MFRRRINRLIEALRNIRIARVPQKDVIIYDSFSERHLYPLLDMSRADVFHVDLRRPNLWIAIRSLRYGKPSVLTYLLAYIATVKPQVVITTCDNSINFYAIKRRFPNVTTIAIQNGRRNTFGPRPNSSFQTSLRQLQHGPNVDYYFTFGTTEIRQFRDLIRATFVCHGNLKNNYLAHLESTKKSEKKSLAYISSLPSFAGGIPESIDSELPTHYFNEHPISHRAYFECEGRVARFLYDYCKRHGLDLTIIGKRDESTPQEAEYFRKAVGDDSLTVIHCSPEGASYRALIQSDFVVSIDSTLAYEMFGRGKRTGFLTMRATAIGIDGITCPNFGFPEVTESSGPFWTNFDDEDEFSRVLDFVTTSSDTMWAQESRRYSDIVMQLDQDNSQLYSLLTRLGVTHDMGIAEVRRRACEVYGV